MSPVSGSPKPTEKHGEPVKIRRNLLLQVMEHEHTSKHETIANQKTSRIPSKLYPHLRTVIFEGKTIENEKKEKQLLRHDSRDKT